MEHDSLELLRKRHPAWALAASRNAPLVLSFLQRLFVEPNASNLPASEVARALDDELFALRERLGDEVYPRQPQAYLDEWADADHGWLRKFYPSGSDEPHFDLTTSVQLALDFVDSLQTRSFIGTESRLNTIVELLRQLAYGTNDDPEHRLIDLRRRRDEIDAQIARAEAGHVDLLDTAAQRDRYQQFARTARELLTDFRQVEDNFRQLDRQLREQVAAWTGSKGDLLDEVLSDRNSISESDQGRSFRAFYDLLLSAERQTELSDLLDHVHGTPIGDDLDPRLARVHFDWIDASERTQHTVRRLSEQLRRFLGDQVWLENRRVFDLLRNVEQKALLLRDVANPAVEMTIDDTSVNVGLPLERPLFRPSRTADLESVAVEVGESEADIDRIRGHSLISREVLLNRVFQVLGAGHRAELSDIVDTAPLEHGLAELVGYFALTEPGLDVIFDDDGRAHVRWSTPDAIREADVPIVTFARRTHTPSADGAGS